MAPTKGPSSGGGGGNVPLVTWMLGIDGSNALETISDVGDASKEMADRMAQQAKTMFPGSTFDVIAKGAKASFGAAAKDAAAFGYAAEKAFEKAEKAAEKLAQRNKEAMSTLKGFAGAGLALGVLYGRSLISQGNSMSGQGAQAGFQQELLSRQVAGLFAPITEENTQRVAELTGWFQKLTGAQQESIRTMAMFTATTGALLYVLPRAGTALAQFMGASAGVSSMAGVGGMVAAAGVGMLAATPEGRDAMTEVMKAFEPALEALLDVVKEFRPAVADFGAFVKEAARETKPLFELLKMRPFGESGPSVAGVGAGLAMNAASSGTFAIWQAMNSLIGQRDVAGSRSELTPRANGFEGVTDTWERLNASAQLMEMQQRTAENTAQTVAQIQQSNLILQAIAAGIPGGSIASTAGTLLQWLVN